MKKINLQVTDYFEWLESHFQGRHPPTLNNAIELLDSYPIEYLRDKPVLAGILDELRQEFDGATLVSEVEKRSPVILETVEFQGGLIDLWITPENAQGKRFGNCSVAQGRFQCVCTDCKHIAEVGDYVLPVYGLPKQNPTNYVCAEDRGLLKNISNVTAQEETR